MKKRLLKSIFYLYLASFIGGCASMQNTQPKSTEPIVDMSLPIIDKIRSINDVTTIALEWDNSGDPRVEGYYIYRTSMNDKNRLQRVARIKDRYSSHFLDSELLPNTTYYYQISSYNETGHESKITTSLKASTLPQFESVSYFTAISELPRRVKLLWRPHTHQAISAYTIQRSDSAKSDWRTIATIDNRLEVEYIDGPLKDDTIYTYRIIARTFKGITSKPSEIVEAKTKPLPLPVLETKATLDRPRQIVITWQPSTQEIDYYRVYRSKKPDEGFVSIAKLNETEFNDNIEENGITMYYKVSVVDKFGLESKLQLDSVRGMTLSSPSTPQITKVTLEDTKAKIEWLPTDSRSENFILRKTVARSFFDKSEPMEFQTNQKHYIDKDVIPGNKYIYQIMSVDKHGLVSRPSEASELYFPKPSVQSN